MQPRLFSPTKIQDVLKNRDVGRNDHAFPYIDCSSEIRCWREETSNPNKSHIIASLILHTNPYNDPYNVSHEEWSQKCRFQGSLFFIVTILFFTRFYSSFLCFLPLLLSLQSQDPTGHKIRQVGLSKWRSFHLSSTETPGPPA